MKRHSLSRVIALFLTIVMAVGMLPASALEVLLSENPQTELGETLPPETPELTLPAQTPPAPEEEAGAEPSAQPLAAGEVPFLGTTGADTFTHQPTLNVRFLAGAGSDVTAAYDVADHDYNPTAWPGTIQISLTAATSHTARKLIIKAPEGSHIVSYSGIADMPSVETLTPTTKFYQDGFYPTDGITQTMALEYALKENAPANFTISLRFNMGLNLQNAFVTSTTKYRLNPYPLAKMPAFDIRYEAEEEGALKTVAVTPEHTVITFRDVPADTNFIKEYGRDYSPWRRIARDRLRNDGLEFSYSPYNPNHQEDKLFYATAPAFSGYRLKLKSKNLAMKIIPPVYDSPTRPTTVTKDGESYILECDFTNELPYVPFFKAQNLPDPLRYVIQGESTVYGETITIELEEFSLLGQDKDGQWTRWHKQTLPENLKIEIRMLGTPMLESMKILNVPKDVPLYFSDTPETKVMPFGEITLMQSHPVDTNENLGFENPRLTIALPDGLSPITKGHYPGKANQPNSIIGVPRLSYDEGKTYTDAAVEYVNTGSSSTTHYEFFLADKGGNMPTHVYFVPKPTSQYAQIFQLLTLMPVGGYKLRGGGEIEPGKPYPYTVTFTADNVTSTDKDVHTKEGTVIYSEYTVKAPENKLVLKEAWRANSSQPPYCHSLYGWEDKGSTEVPLYCTTLNGPNRTAYRGELRVENGSDPLEALTHKNARFRLSSEDCARITEIFAPEFPRDPGKDKSTPVTVLLSGGEEVSLLLGRGGWDPYSYVAPEGQYIKSAEFTIREIELLKLPVNDDTNVGRVTFSYKYSLPSSGVGNTDAQKKYFTLEFMGSDGTPPQAPGTPISAFTVERELFRGKPSDVANMPDDRGFSGLQYAEISPTAGERIVVSHVTRWSPVFSNFAGSALNPVNLKPPLYQNADINALVTPQQTIAYKIAPDFRYANGSVTATNLGGTRIPVSAQWLPRHFSDGSGLLRISSQEPTTNLNPTFSLSVNIDTPTGSKTPITAMWQGADLSGAVSMSGKSAHPDGMLECTINYSYGTQQTEGALGFDVNGDGKVGTEQDSVAFASTEAFPVVTVSEVKQEDVVSYGTSAGDGESTSNHDYYGADTDNYTYRTYLLAQQEKDLDGLVMYIPVPRAGTKPDGSAAALNEWNAKLMAISGDIIADTNGTYKISYYAGDKEPTMYGLKGQADSGYTEYVRGSPPSPETMAKIKMIKIEAPSVPKDTADDIELTFTCDGKKPVGALKNHMETYYVYQVKRAGLAPLIVTGPTVPSISYTLTANSVAGTVYTDANYNARMDTFGDGDSPAAGVVVTLYDAAGNPAGITATTDANGKFVMEAHATGKYSIGVEAKPSENRKLMYARGVPVDFTTGKSELFEVGRTGVQGIELGYRDRRSFTLYSDVDQKVPITPTTVVDVMQGGDTLVRYALSPSYFLDATTLFTHTVSQEGMFSVTTGAASAYVSTLHGLKVTGKDNPVTIEVSIDDGMGGTDAHSFKVRVLPPRVVVEFGSSLNYYTDVLYYKNSLLGDVTFKNRADEDTDEVLKNFAPTKMVLVRPDGTKEDRSGFLTGDSRTFAEGDIGKYEIIFAGVDSRGRPIVDIYGSENIVRTIYMHGYPVLMKTAPLHIRVGVEFNPKKEANGADWLTATHKHVETGGAAVQSELFSARDNNVSLSHYKAYTTDGARKFKQKMNNTTSQMEDIEYTTLPAEPGMYEVYYSVHLGHDTTVQMVHRTLYLHGSPVMKVPGVITMRPDPNSALGGPIDLDYAATAVWMDKSMVMEPLLHVNENGTLSTYGTETSLFFLKNGTLLPLPHRPDPISGQYVVVSVRGEGDYNLPDVGGVDGGTAKSNVFLDKDSSEAIKNAPGIYPATVIFQDTIDGLGAAGAPNTWDENKQYAFNRDAGVGYVEMAVNVVITEGDILPILPSQDQLVVNFVMGDSNRFDHLEQFDDQKTADIEAIAAGSTAEKAAAQALLDGLAGGSVRQYDYTHKNASGQMEAHGIIRYFKAVAANGDATKGDTGLLKMVETAIQTKSHDIDVHSLLDSVTGGGLTQEEYNDLHGRAIDFLWDNHKLTELRYVDTAGKTVVNHNPDDKNLITATQNPGTYELTVTAANIHVEAVGEQTEEIGADFYQNYGWRIEVQKDKVSHATYKCYVSSDLKFRLADHTKPMITFGLHLPVATPHSSMEAEAFYIDGKTGKERTIVIPPNQLDISTPGTAVMMNYRASHPITKAVSTSGSAFASLRNTEALYKGIAFVNSSVRLLNDGVPLPIEEIKHRVLTGVPTDLTNGGKVTAELDKFVAIDAPKDLVDYGSVYPTGTWSKTGDILPGAGVAATIPGAQSVPTHFYEMVGNTRVPIDSPTKMNSIYPGVKTILLSAEDVSTVGGAYHNGPNRTEKTTTFVFDSPISLTFGPQVKTVGGEKTVTVLSTAGQGDIKEALAAIAVVTYGENPGAPISLLLGTKFTKDASGKYESVTVSATDMRLRTKSERVNIVLQDQAVIRIVLQDASGAPLAEVTPPEDVIGAVIGSPYTVFAPYLAGYVLAAGEKNTVTVASVLPGINTVTFRYAPVKPGEVMAKYAVDYTHEGALVQENTQVGVVGKSVSHTAAAEFVKGTYKYTLKAGESKTKTLTLNEDKTQNVLSFAYDRAEIPGSGGGGGGGGGGGTVVVNHYAVLYAPGSYGTLTGAAGEQVRSGGKPKSVPTVTAREGYTFKGWYLDDIAQLIDPKTQVITKSTTFRAAYLDESGELVSGTPEGGIPALELTNHIAYLQGDESSNFRPDAGITRAEVVVMFSRLLKDSMPTGLTLSSKFRDVDVGKWYANIVAYMERFGIIAGYEDGTFRPEAPISRSEFITIASRFSQLELTDKQFFSDVAADNWAAVYISSAKLKGWIDGYEDGSFRPNKGISRSEAVKVVNALLGRTPDTAYMDEYAEKLKAFPDLAKAHWAYYEIMEGTNAHDHSGKPERWINLQ